MSTAPPTALDRARTKAYLRLLPLLFLCYVIAYVDRTNVAHRQADDDQGPAGVRQRGHRLRVGGLLHRLLPAGDPRHADRREVERAEVDQPDHDLLGDRGGADGLREDPLALLHGPVLPRPGRGRVLPRRDRLPDPLVPQPRPRAGPGVVLHRHADRPDRQPEALERAAQDRRRSTAHGPHPCSGHGGLAVGLHRLGHPGGDPGGPRPDLPDRPARAGALARARRARGPGAGAEAREGAAPRAAGT